jgi:hypothetical protein
MARFKAAMPDDSLFTMMADLRRQAARHQELADTAELIGQAESLAKLGKTAQAAELLKQAAAALPSD